MYKKHEILRRALFGWANGSGYVELTHFNPKTGGRTYLVAPEDTYSTYFVNIAPKKGGSAIIMVENTGNTQNAWNRVEKQRSVIGAYNWDGTQLSVRVECGDDKELSQFQVSLMVVSLMKRIASYENR